MQAAAIPVTTTESARNPMTAPKDARVECEVEDVPCVRREIRKSVCGGGVDSMYGGGMFGALLSDEPRWKIESNVHCGCHDKRKVYEAGGLS